MTAAMAVGLAAPSAIAQGQSSGSTYDSWRPDYRIGAVRFNYPLPLDPGIDELKNERDGYFAFVMPDTGAIVRGYVFPDPATGREGARAIWTESKHLGYRGVRVGVHYRTAQRRLGRGWKIWQGARECAWLYRSSIHSGRTGPVSTQVYFDRRTGRVFRIALNEITEIGCPRR